VPVFIYQLGHHSFPPLKTIPNTNLPTPASSFLGRENELYDADLLLQGTRLLTVTGPGGAGKTRFSLELATRAREERFSDYRDGVFSCFFSSLRDPSLVLATIAYTLSVSEQPGESALETLSSHLEGKQMLVLLDNLEHLLEAASELSELLSACPGLTMLCTSRELLGVRGERAYDLPPLADAEGVALFCERAEVEPSNDVATLCSRLEGLPLAIELAAARTRILTPGQLLDRLSKRLDLLKAGGDGDPRQQTLRATIAWSYELLSPEEQQLFARLAVFSGGCTLDAAEEACDADVGSLQSLVEKSLLRFTGERYWMLETIGEYAAERLERSDEASGLKVRHARTFASLAEAAEPEIEGAAAQVWTRLEADRDNLASALALSMHSGLGNEALTLAWALGHLWYESGRLREGRAGLESVLEAVKEPSSGRAKVLDLTGVLALEQGDLERGRELIEESLDLARLLGDQKAEANALGDLAWSAFAGGSPEDAIAITEEAIRLSEELGYARGSALGHANLGFVYRAIGQPDLASAALEEAVRRSRDLANHALLANALNELAAVRIDQAEYDDAGELLREALQLALEMPLRRNIEWSLRLAAMQAIGSGAPLVGAGLAGAADAIAREIAAAAEPTEVALLERHLAEARALVGEARFAEAWSAGAAMSLDEAVAYALDSGG
jgi:predicted ATPase